MEISPSATDPVSHERGGAGAAPNGGILPHGHGLLVGRQDECGQIDLLLEAAGDGMSAVLVLQGEPGIGKTALLNYAIESARGLHLVRLVGIESEAEIGFAGRHQTFLAFLGSLSS